MAEMTLGAQHFDNKDHLESSPDNMSMISHENSKVKMLKDEIQKLETGVEETEICEKKAEKKVKLLASKKMKADKELCESVTRKRKLTHELTRKKQELSKLQQQIKKSHLNQGRSEKSKCLEIQTLRKRDLEQNCKLEENGEEIKRLKRELVERGQENERLERKLTVKTGMFIRLNDTFQDMMSKCKEKDFKIKKLIKRLKRIKRLRREDDKRINHFSNQVSMLHKQILQFGRQNETNKSQDSNSENRPQHLAAARCRSPPSSPPDKVE